MIVVDTNVIAYLLIEGERTARARALWDIDPDWRAPGLWRHEYLNVLATFVRQGGATLSEAALLWRRAVDLLAASESEVDMLAALDLAVQHKISAYDAQYVVLARRLGAACVTEDRELLSAFPAVAVTIEAYCARGS